MRLNFYCKYFIFFVWEKVENILCEENGIPQRLGLGTLSFPLIPSYKLFS